MTFAHSTAWGRRSHTFKHTTHSNATKCALGERNIPSNCLSWRQFDRTVRPPYHLTLNCATAGFRESMTGSRSTTSSSELLEPLKWFRVVFPTGLKPEMNTCAFLLILAVQIHADSVEGPTGKSRFVWRRACQTLVCFWDTMRVLEMFSVQRTCLETFPITVTFGSVRENDAWVARWFGLCAALLPQENNHAFIIIKTY